MTAEKNSEYDIAITGTSSDGRGIGRIDGMTVFVTGAVEGDICRVRITSVKKRFAEGVLTVLEKPSPHRTEPECPHFGQCGGCQTAHTEYTFEAKSKSNRITQALRRIGGFDGLSPVPVEKGQSRRCRNKAVYKIGFKNGAPVCGFFENKSHAVAAVDDCLLCSAYDKDIKNALLLYIRETGCKNISELFIRRSSSGNQTMLALRISGALPSVPRLVNLLTAADKSVVSVILDAHGKCETVFGKSFITDTLLGLEFKISYRSFFQVNHEMTERLYAKALEYAALTGKERVLDIYCGIGTISLCAARSAKAVTGVEIVPDAVSNARENAKANGIKNAVFFADSAENIVPRLIDSGERPDVVILDPPRRGSDSASLGAILKAAPKRIVYISCDPATLARDLKLLAAGGYTLSAAHAYDMFPRTAHVECVVLMSRVDN